MEETRNSAAISKAIRLIDYLQQLALLKTKLVRSTDDYEKVLWLDKIPHQKGCFTQAWGRDEEYDSDIWVEIQTKREPALPTVPEKCKSWVDGTTLRTEDPGLHETIVQQVKNPEWKESSDLPEYVSVTLHNEDSPEVQIVWNQYYENQWFPWWEEHSAWESINAVYTEFFTIHQEIRRLGENYEFVLGLGLLTWKTPANQLVKRHLIVANASLEFDARLGKFTVRPNMDSAVLRPELDMLDIDERPSGAEDGAKISLTRANDDPWQRECVEEALRKLVHSINPLGEYNNTLKRGETRATYKPIAEYAPALILRKRNTKGLHSALSCIRKKIENGEHIPVEFADLAEIRDTDQNLVSDKSRESGGDFDGELFFPKPSNEEQRRIVSKMRTSSGVLVQGPPGTGKSHTIANLICHLLATGQRTLVTAKTPRALKVLEGLLPEDMRSLCINLLGDGLEEKRSLEASVSGILHKKNEWNELLASAERKKSEQNLRSLREEKAEVDRRLRAIRESETHSHSIGEGRYQGKAARIVEAISRDKSAFEWFEDEVKFDKSCPVSEGNLRNVLADLRYFTPVKRQDIALISPDSWHSCESVSVLFTTEEEAEEKERMYSSDANGQVAYQMCHYSTDILQEINDVLTDFQEEYRRLIAMPFAWVRNAVRDVLSGNSNEWHQVLTSSFKSIKSVSPHVSMADEIDIKIDMQPAINLRTVLEDVRKLKSYLENDGKLGWWIFRSKLVKERAYVFKNIRVNGQPPSSLEHLSRLADALHVHVESEKIWKYWDGRTERTQGPFSIQFAFLEAQCTALGDIFDLEKLRETCRNVLRKCPNVIEPHWSNESAIDTLIATCRLADALARKQKALGKIRKIEEPLIELAARENAHPAVTDMIEAISTRDLKAYALASNKIEDLCNEVHRLYIMTERLGEIRRHLPVLVDKLERTFNLPVWETRISDIDGAWCWAQANHWIKDYINKEDAPALAQRSRQIDEQISETIARVASLCAWDFLFSRLEEKHERHMVSWQQKMRRLGKGTGKNAPFHRREAQEHLNNCREAVPAWVMPLHRVWDTIEPSPGMFDVIIVDEASQCGFEALPLLYLAKKILIVGDDKQISPEAVGVTREEVFRLREEFLFDFEFSSSFDVESSLFDQARVRHVDSCITLTEHFRCMPEIIRFSNDLCYSDTPLIPLRQYGEQRLKPLEPVFVNGGYREGTDNRVINRPEAKAIAKKIHELCIKKQYSGKTMGVVVLQGNAQGSLIETELLKYLGPVEFEKRKLVCGNPYSFQGDERDIMFLSMVAAPGVRIRSLSTESDKRRFNVAASRAKDQMWLFHSVRREDLSEKDLRRRLLEFFEDKKTQQIAEIPKEELERRAHEDNRNVVKAPKPFDSWFEVDVALELLRREYTVIPQLEIAKKFIDIAVIGKQGRLAVECDGDRWHPPEKYDEDMLRQRKLERCGWEFFRIRESSFYANRVTALQKLWRMLEEREIFPQSAEADTVQEEEFSGESENLSYEYDFQDEVAPSKQDDDSNNTDISANPKLNILSSHEISRAIIDALIDCPNNTCTVHSMTRRVLRILEIKTRGKPWTEFEKRVMLTLDMLENHERIARYKAKNERIRLLT